MFVNWPRYLKFGGARGTGIAMDQSGTKRPMLKSSEGQNAAGPINDRGRGR